MDEAASLTGWNGIFMILAGALYNSAIISRSMHLCTGCNGTWLYMAESNRFAHSVLKHSSL